MYIDVTVCSSLPISLSPCQPTLGDMRMEIDHTDTIVMEYQMMIVCCNGDAYYDAHGKWYAN